jgi:hypothetical protein
MYTEINSGEEENPPDGPSKKARQKAFRFLPEGRNI